LAFKNTLNIKESPLKPSTLALLNEKSHCFNIFAAWIFLDIEQESSPKDTNTKQITIFANMLNFFIAKIPELRSRVKFTNFAAATLLFAGLAGAAINVSTSDNVEITAFMQSESRKILQTPDTLTLDLTFQTAKDKHSRAFFLFFIGERRVSLKMDYSANLPTGPFKGTMQADTSWYTGYCGMIECQTKPMPAQQRIEVMKALVTRLLTELNSKFYLIFKQNPVSVAPTNAVDSTAANAVDSTAATGDSVSAPAPDSVSQ
jgi:hypothetical protein